MEVLVSEVHAHRQIPEIKDKGGDPGKMCTTYPTVRLPNLDPNISTEMHAPNLSTEYGKTNSTTLSEEQSKERGDTQPHRHEGCPEHCRNTEMEVGRPRGKNGSQQVD